MIFMFLFRKKIKDSSMNFIVIFDLTGIKGIKNDVLYINYYVYFQ